MSVVTHAVLVYGLVWEEAGSPPWHASQDQVAGEDFASRLRRRAALLGRDPIDARDCLVGEHGDLDTPMWWLAVGESHLVSEHTHPRVIPPLAVGDDWDSRLAAFCEICDVPWAKPGWCLMTLLVH